MRMPWKNVYIFVSSTFNDMHAERDYLAKRVFPELAQWCLQRRLRLYDIDLRWGISEEDAARNKRVVDICLRNVDSCRPFFMTFLGQRRGWVPGAMDVSEDTFLDFPNVRPEVGRRSVTELEVYHALKSFADASQRPVREPLFFFREDGYLADQGEALRCVFTNEGEGAPERVRAADAALQAFKREMRDARYPVTDYRARWDQGASTPELSHMGDAFSKGRLVGLEADGLPLADVILALLQRQIDAEFGREPVSGIASPLERELAQQELFLNGCQEMYVPDEPIHSAFQAALDRGKLVVLSARAGMGKTTFLANAAARVEDGTELIYRFLGVSDMSGSAGDAVASIYEELLERRLIAEGDLPKTPLENARVFMQVLGVAAQKRPLLLLIDGLNQVGDPSRDFAFLRAELPNGVRMAVGVKAEGEGAARFIEAKLKEGATPFTYSAFEGEDKRRALIGAHLSRFLKNLDDHQLREIAALPSANNPLFLSIVLNELRIYGSFQGLMDKVRTDFGDTPRSAFEGVLGRLERDPAYTPIEPGQAIPAIFSHLAVARRGLPPDALAALMVLTTGGRYTEREALDALYYYVNQLRSYLVRRDGLIAFLYESLGEVAARYAQVPTQAHARVLQALDGEIEGVSYRGGDAFALSERIYHLYQLSPSDARAALLSPQFMEAKAVALGARALAGDIELFPYEGDQALRELRTALLLSAPAIEKDRDQLLEQLQLRLCASTNAEVQALLSALAARRKTPWLRAVRAEAYDVTRGLSAASDLGEGDFQLIEIDGDELFIRAGCDVHILDKHSFQPLKSVQAPYEFKLPPRGRSHYGDFSDIGYNTSTARHEGVTKRGRLLIFLRNPAMDFSSTAPNKYKPAALAVYDLDAERYLPEIALNGAELAANASWLDRKMHPEYLDASRYRLIKIDIFGDILTALFAFEDDKEHAVTVFDLKARTGRSRRLFSAGRAQDFLCNGALAYLYVNSASYEKAHRLIALDSGHVDCLKATTQMVDQLCFFDNKFLLNNQIYDGATGRHAMGFGGERCHYVLIGEEFLVAVALPRDMKDEHRRRLRYEELSRDDACTVFLFKKGVPQVHGVARIAYRQSRWARLFGSLCALEMRAKNQVGITDLKDLFGRIQQGAGKGELNMRFQSAFHLEMASAGAGDEFDYLLDRDGNRLIALAGGQLSSIESRPEVDFEGSVTPSQWRLPEKPGHNQALHDWQARMRNTRGRSGCWYVEGFNEYYLTGEKLLCRAVDTGAVAAYPLPRELAIDMPEGTRVEIWEEVLKRDSSAEDARKKAQQIRIAQNIRFVAVEGGVAYFASAFDLVMLIYAFDFARGQLDTLVFETLNPGDGIAFEHRVRFVGGRIVYGYAYSGGAEFTVVYDAHARREASRERGIAARVLTLPARKAPDASLDGEQMVLRGAGGACQSRVTLGKNGGSLAVFAKPDNPDAYVMVNEELVFKVSNFAQSQ